MTDTFQKEILRELHALRDKVEYIKEFLEDTRLTFKEKRFTESKLKKLQKGDKSDFVEWRKAKKNSVYKYVQGSDREAGA